MTAKEYLRQAMDASKQIDADARELYRLRSAIEAVGATDYAKDKVQASSHRSTEEGLIRLIAMQDMVNAEIDRYADIRDAIRRQIMQLPSATERTVLLRRYISGQSWQQIARDTHYSLRSVLYIHGQALNTFADLHSIALLDML